jgi:HlyD family secretion protein
MWGVGLAVVVVVGLSVAFWPSGKTWVYDTVAVEQGDLTVEVTAIGTLEPLHTVAVNSEVSGTVARVHVDTNDTVTAGQVLAELDTELLEAELRRTRAASRAADASRAQAQITAEATALDLARAQTLHGSGALSDAALEQAETAHKQAVASVSVAEAQSEQARAALSSSRTQLSKTTLTSPISGVVLARNVDPGQAVVSSLQAAVLFEVAEGLDRMSVDVDIDEADIGRVREGQKADFTVAAFPDRVFTAEVDKVELAPKTLTQVVTYVACLHLDNPDNILRPGMTATARIETETFADAVLVPNAALRWAPADPADLPPPVKRAGKQVQRVWRLDGTPEPVEIVVSATNGRMSVLAEGPLSAGDALVVGAEEIRVADDPDGD